MPIKFYIPPFLWASVIFVIIAIPGNYIPRAHGFWELISPDKIVHLGMFAPLAFLIARATFKAHKQFKLAVIIALLFGIIYAIFTELLQYYVVYGRNGNIFDAIADIVGVVIGLLLFHRIGK
jgi:VanZ family protein